MTTTYWLVGRRIVDQEQLGSARVAYGDISAEPISGGAVGSEAAGL